MHIKSLTVVIATLTLMCACETVVPAPGADKVRVTNVGSDVASCTVLGNIKVPLTADGLPRVKNADVEFRNQAVGLGGNVAFITLGSPTYPKEGIAYRCP